MRVDSHMFQNSWMRDSTNENHMIPENKAGQINATNEDTHIDNTVVPTQTVYERGPHGPHDEYRVGTVDMGMHPQRAALQRAKMTQQKETHAPQQQNVNQQRTYQGKNKSTDNAFGVGMVLLGIGVIYLLSIMFKE